MRTVATIMAFFIIAQLLGTFAGAVVQMDLAYNPYVSSLVVTSDTSAPANAIFFLVYVLAGALVMIVMIRLLKKFADVFRLLEFVLIATSSSIVFYAFLRFGFGFGLGYGESTLGGIILGLAMATLKIAFPKVDLKNPAAILSTAGVGVVFGISMGLVPVVLFLVLLAIYDYLSVFMTKHMVEMANFVVEKNLAFTVTAKEPGPPGERERRLDLGTGDMIAPVMLEVSLLNVNPLASGFVFVGAVVSMGLFLYAVRKKKVVLPALPPIVVGMLIFLALGYVLKLY